jgi:serine kinase of HPr protein (carbohydrate metabolism regulator)
MLLHATCVAINGRAVLITGDAGVGKSDLALRLMDAGAQLVADDQVELKSEQGRLMAAPPAPIAGLMEVRHVGLMRVPSVTNVAVSLYIELLASSERLERLPEVESILLLDHPVRRLSLPSFAASTPSKIRAALHYPMA